MLQVLRQVPGSLTYQRILRSEGQRVLDSFVRPISSTQALRHERLYQVLPPLESFSKRHIGPSQEEADEMLKFCGVEVRTEATL